MPRLRHSVFLAVASLSAKWVHFLFTLPLGVEPFGGLLCPFHHLGIFSFLEIHLLMVDLIVR